MTRRAKHKIRSNECSDGRHADRVESKLCGVVHWLPSPIWWAFPPPVSVNARTEPRQLERHRLRSGARIHRTFGWPFSPSLLLLASWPLALVWMWLIAQGSVAFDWRIYVEAGERVWSGDLYAVSDTYGWRYSPLLAYVTPALEWIGPDLWRLLHFVPLFAFGPLGILIGLSWPFWFDVQHGSMIVGIVALAYLALRGHRTATVAFLVIAVLIPRPIMLPALAWLLWRQPWTRWPFLGMAVVSLLGAFVTGWGDEWVRALLRGGMAETGSWLNLSPSRFVGAWWLAIGIPLAAWLTRRGRIGLASVAVSPYLLPYYLLFGLTTDCRSRRSHRAARRATSLPEPSIRS